jgi:antitoxin component YwqK of YwqJK toxin-antitoxin module
MCYLFLVLFLACTEQNSADKKSTEALSTLTGANEMAFEDTPGLSKVTVNDPAGAPSQSGVTKNGNKAGSWVEYHPGGLVKSFTSYVDGKKEGMQIELNNNGQLEKRMLYHNDLLHGEYKEFKYSTLKEERYYEKGKLEGVVKVYYDNGKIMEEGAYKNGTRDGVSKWYDQEGNVTIEYEYQNGELIKKY